MSITENNTDRKELMCTELYLCNLIFRFNLMAVVPDRRIALTQRIAALEMNQKRVKEAVSKIGKHMRHLLAKSRDYNGNPYL